MKAIVCATVMMMNLSFIATLQAQTIKTDRYTNVKVSPSVGQLSPLEEVTRIVFGDDVSTVGEAIVEVLDGTGYELRHIKDVYEKPIDSILMAQPLPEIHRQLGPITVYDALEVLAGEAWHLKTNVLGRELWFVLNAHYSKDKARLQRLLKEVDAQKGSASDAGLFFLDFPPGNVNRPKNIAAFNTFVQSLDLSRVASVSINGLSHSKGSSGSVKLAKARALFAQKQMDKLGVPLEKMKVSYHALNNQPVSKSGVRVTVDYEKKTSTESMASTNTKTKTSPKDERVIEAPTVYRFYRGEDLETALRRWVERAGYVDLVWDVKDRDDHFVTLPISADAIFNCDFLECLRRVKKAYAEADSPRYFDITARGGNRIVTIQLLHLNGNR